jgi:DNA-binding PadR family transcriptional regulator
VLEINQTLKFAVLRISLAGGKKGIVELSRELRLGPSKLDRVVSELQDEGLLDVSQVHSGKAGRPRIWVQVTALGEEFLGAYESLTTKSLKSRRSDLRRAAADADYAKQLAARGISSYTLFVELNSLAMVTRRLSV